MHAIIATAPGGPEVLSPIDAPDPAPGPGEVVVEVAAAGVNFIDTYRRAGLYPMPYPHVVGTEGAGRVVALGDGVVDLALGDRVAWVIGASYTTHAVVRAADAVPVPDSVDDESAAALLLQGVTAHYLSTSTVELRPGDEVLVHAAAGGVGLLLTQLATARGARVLATVGSVAKEELARRAGAAEVIRYRELADLSTDVPRLVRELTDGRGVRAVYDSVGKDTFDGSLAALAPRGVLVLFGASSGPVPPVDPQRLNAAGSVYLTRPSIGAYTRTRAELTGRTDELFADVAAGRLTVRIGARFSLDEAGDAHRALEGRATTGKVLLLP